PGEEIARLGGRAGSRTTGVIYRRELRPVITTGAEVMDRIGRGNRAKNRRPSQWLRVGGQVSGLLGGGGPAGQQREAIGGGGGCRRGVDEQRESWVGGKLHGLEVEVEGADDGVAESLAAGPVEAD